MSDPAERAQRSTEKDEVVDAGPAPGDPIEEKDANAVVRAYHFFEGNFGQGTIAGVIFLIGFLIWIAFFDPLR